MRRPSGSFLFSLALHTALAVLLANVVLHYEIIFAPPVLPPAPVQESISYVALSPPAGAVGGTTATPPARATEPSRTIVAPPRIPATVARPAPAPPAAGTPGGAAGGTGAGGGRGVTTGIVPSDADPRLAVDAKFFYPASKTHGQRVDSAVKASIGAYNDSVARAYASAGKQPGDWTFKDDNGRKWGVDGNKIYLGKFAIPSAVLAALPIRIQGNPGEGLSDRLAPSRRADVALHAQSQLHDQEFKTAVKRIRERKERERREKEKDNEGRGVAQSTSGSR
ncbi:MAG: hypothetical protein ABIP93_07455 [Gemmatimonadaceae bacterium]